MTRITLDSDLRSKLLNLSHPLELCDESGRVLARLLPTFDPSRYEGLEPQISRDELERRKQHKGRTYTTAEVLAHLETL
jgi:hypothetical protein